MILKIRVANDFPNFAEVGKLLLKAKLRFVRTKVQLAKQILQSIFLYQ